MYIISKLLVWEFGVTDKSPDQIQSCEKVSFDRTGSQVHSGDPTKLTPRSPHATLRENAEKPKIYI